ncbi:peroxidase family protein [Shimia biformata]|uniref:peroxidase family protein n=1 Tax=Shimia biformata TaxID=1294299 RepID=UPI00194DE9C6|nr:peroxidase family protein [Shimia biformata]
MGHYHGGSFRLIAGRDVTVDKRDVILLRQPGTAQQDSFRFLSEPGFAQGPLKLDANQEAVFQRILRGAPSRTLANGSSAVQIDAYDPIWGDYPNSPTLSLNAIDTAELVEIGQNLTKPCSAGDPSPGNSQCPAAYTYFGQFIAHDLSDMVVETAGTTNLQTASLDLSSVFGTDIDFAQSFVGPTTPQNDLRDIARDAAGAPEIKDRRNDANLAVAQVHNMVARFFLRERAQPGQTEATARRATINYFQTAVMQDYLPRIVGQAEVNAVLAGPRLLQQSAPFLIPMEFALACFRFGHAQVRDNYFHGFAPQSVTPGDLIDFTHAGGLFANTAAGDPKVLPSDWQMVWPKMIGATATLRTRRIAARIANNHGEIKSAIVNDAQAPDGGRINLAAETLIRGKRLHLPSAQVLIAWIKANHPLVPLAHIDLQDAATLDKAARFTTPALRTLLENGLAENTPLWLYTLLESQAASDGEQLGPLAGRIVAETLIAAIEADPQGILSPGNTFQALDLNGTPVQGNYGFDKFVERAFSP